MLPIGEVTGGKFRLLDFKKNIIFISLILSLSAACSHAGTDKNGISQFSDNTDDYKGVSLFSFLNPYPVVKSFFTNMDPVGFNEALGDALSQAPRTDNLGTIRALESAMLQSRTSVQTLSLGLADMIEKMQTSNPAAYSSIQPVFEKIRHYNKPVVRNLMPLGANQLLIEYNTKTANQVATSIHDTADILTDPDSVDTLHDIEDFLYKGLRKNTTFRTGVENLLGGFFAPSLLTDRTLKEGFISLVYDFGEMMYKAAGFEDQMTPQTSFKNFIINAENFFTANTTSPAEPTANEYSTNAAYNNPGGTLKPTELRTMLRDLFSVIKGLIIPSGDVTVNILKETSKNAYMLDFMRNSSGSSQTFKDLLQLDGDGRNRQTDIESRPVSALETLFIVITLGDIYGYRWNPVGTQQRNNMLTDTGPVTTGGELTLGDSMFSMGSIIAASNESDNFNFKNITENSRTGGNTGITKVFRDDTPDTGPATADAYRIGFNTRVLSILEAPSRGETLPITDTSTGTSAMNESSFDKLYNKTIPWMLDWVVKVTLEGYGPYYSKKDGSGNPIAPNGDLLHYQPNWNTAQYYIQVTPRIGMTASDRLKCDPNPNGTAVTNAATAIETECRIYMGGFQEGATNPATANPGATKGFYSISETVSTPIQVASDEEAFYKNLQWLLYEKRFVAVLPVRAKLAATVTYEEALFITAIGNGIMGMMNLAPNCGPLKNDCINFNGYWAKKGTQVKNYSDQGTGLQDLSNEPGDSVFLMEGWGYGLAGDESFQVTAVYSALFPLLIPDPTTVYGMIPPVISQNAGAIKQLGFLGTTDTPPSQVNTNWNKRNRLTPFIVALAKALGDDAKDPANRPLGKNPYKLLTNLAEIFSRPYLFYGLDTTETKTLPATAGPPVYNIPAVPSILQIRTVGVATGFRNPSATPVEYKPSKNYRSLLSILIEGTSTPTSTDRNRMTDGPLDLLSKTDILSGLIKFTTNLGDPAKTDARDKVMGGLSGILGQTKLWSDCGGEANFYTNCPNQFAIDKGIDWLVYRVADKYDDRPRNDLYAPSWVKVDDLVRRIRDYVSRSSGWSLVKSLDFLLDLLLDIQLTAAEITNTLDLVSSLFYVGDDTDPNNSALDTRTYTISDIVTTSLPPVLDSMAPYGRNLYATGYQLGKPGSFFSFLEKNANMSSQYTVEELFENTKVLLRSDMIQTSLMDNRAFLYSAGTLIGLFGDIYERGRRFSGSDAFFYDNWNEGQPTSTYWDDMNAIFSLR
ncbi:hypothetical protein EHR06_01040 [Leptospira dzoumogneensis]|uniref:Uncharacterized protein n=2 Tax=Leptospira dzoumogneensis TaxID=2484904 RepID=A0A4Z1AIM1_9LEPT|nr:hypothetical protein [Leptospira dzoumogneensis]TGN04037.1 hypothetical protein EHR06_01040 [Leptospira dzoumogneensis]